MAGPKMYDPNILIQAGINPKTGLPVKMGGTPCTLKEDIRKLLRVKDGQTAVNRFKWDGLPKGLDPEMIERILYYKGQGAFFYMKEDDKWYFLPYALSGTVDVYGRYMGIIPLQFAGGNTSDDKGKDKPFIVGMQKRPLYSLDDEFTDKSEICVLLQDRSPQYNTGMILSRQVLNDPLLDVMAECIPFMRTSLIAGTGIKGMRVDDADQQREVENAANSITDAALTGSMYVPVVVPVELQELTDGALSKSEEYMSAFQSLENFRLSTYGLENGGAFQKKAHMLQSEQDMNASNTSLIMEDSLRKRKFACDLINKIAGTNATVEVNEQAMKQNINYEDLIGGGENGFRDNSGSDDSAV